jgi:hypothetical protein
MPSTLARLLPIFALPVAAASAAPADTAAASPPFLHCTTELSARAYPPPDQEVTLTAALASLQR